MSKLNLYKFTSGTLHADVLFGDWVIHQKKKMLNYLAIKC